MAEVLEYHERTLGGLQMQQQQAAGQHHFSRKRAFGEAEQTKLYQEQAFKRTRCVPTLTHKNNREQRNLTVRTLVDRFPTISEQTVDEVLASCNENVEKASECLQQLQEASASINESEGKRGIGLCESAHDLNCRLPEDQSKAEDATTSVVENELDFHSQLRTQCVEYLVSLLSNATSVVEAKEVAGRALKMFQKKATLSPESMRQFQEVMKENAILKRAVAIQNEKIVSEKEHHLKVINGLRQLIASRDEQLRNLEVANYSLKAHIKHMNPNSHNFPNSSRYIM